MFMERRGPLCVFTEPGEESNQRGFVMKKLGLITLALLAGTAMAAAQGMNAQQQGGNKTERAAPAPQAQQKAPAEKMGAGHQAQSQSKPAETTGQASKDADMKSGADMKAKDSTAQKPDDKAGAGKATTGQNDKASMDTKANDKTKSSMDNKANDKTKSSMDNKANDNKNAASNNNKQQNTTGQGAAGGRGAANLSTEQKTKIRTVVKEKVHAQPLTNVNFSISVGTVVPRSVHFYPLPAEVVTIYPQWRGYEFILVNDEIIIIEPSSYKIVAIIA
jgi:hypothetical protein